MTAALLIFAIENADTVPFLSSHSTAYFLATCSEFSMPLYLSETFVVCIRARETPRRVVYPACLVRRDIVLILTGYWTVADFAFATEGLPDARKNRRFSYSIRCRSPLICITEGQCMKTMDLNVGGLCLEVMKLKVAKGSEGDVLHGPLLSMEKT